MNCSLLKGVMGQKLFSKSAGVRVLLTSSLTTVVAAFLPHHQFQSVGGVGGTGLGHYSKPLHCSGLVRRSVSGSADKPSDQVEDNLLSNEEWSEVLPFEKGSHNSAKIIIPAVPQDADPFLSSLFRARLESTVAACRELGKSSMWVHVPMTRASLIEDMAESGLRFHHADGTVAVLNLWLRDSESKIPEFATHNVGVGAVVINSRNEILCVRELRKNYLPWKTPTGLTELGESLDEAAVREVEEETGVRTHFHSILSFRQTHGLTHGRSDMFFVCRLDPVEEMDADGKAVIPEPVPQENEIECAAWVPYSEYHDMVMDPEQGHPMMQHVLQVMEANQKVEQKVVPSVIPGRQPHAVYFPAMEAEPRDLC